jgi:hypothetical protein
MVGFLFNFKRLKKLCLRTGNTLLTALNENLIGLELFTSFTFSISILTRKSDLDTIFLLKANSILAALTNEGSMILVRNLEDFGSFISLE